MTDPTGIEPPDPVDPTVTSWGPPPGAGPPTAPFDTSGSAPPPVPPDAAEANGRRWKTWHLALTAVVALLLGVGIGAAGAGSDTAEEDRLATSDSTTTTSESTTTTEAPTTTVATTTSRPPTTTTTAPPRDVEVASFSGSGAQTTRPFEVGDGWEVQWDASGDLLQIYVYDAGGDLVGVAANQQGGGGGSAYQAGGGTFYLQMNAIGNWTVKVVDVP